MSNTNGTALLGALEDTRPDDQKLKDFWFKEIASVAAPVIWKEKKEIEWRTFPIQNQDGSGSCVMQTIRKLAGILMYLKKGYYVEMSAAFYQLRSNRPQAGMIGVEAFDIWMKQGVPLGSLVKSDNLDDTQMDALKIEDYEKTIAKEFAIGGHVGLDSGDFETVASVIQTTGKGVMVWFYFTAAEWSQLIPTIDVPDLLREKALRHSVAAVDFLLFDGKKYLLVEDSAHFGGHTKHLISEEFFKARNWFARYPMNLKFADTAPFPRPQYTFRKPLEFGQDSFDIIWLQDVLRYEGLYPVNTASTGYYGAITAKGVLQWQIKHGVAPLPELTLLAGRKVGPKTLKALNFIYGQ